MLRRLQDVGWMAAFVVLCAIWGFEVMKASEHIRAYKHSDIWICPILGECGPAGTPGLGRW